MDSTNNRQKRVLLHSQLQIENTVFWSWIRRIHSCKEQSVESKAICSFSTVLGGDGGGECSRRREWQGKGLVEEPGNFSELGQRVKGEAGE